jgi:hypothetical protein
VLPPPPAPVAPAPIPAPAPVKQPTLQATLAALGLDGKAMVTGDDMRALMAALQESQPVAEADVLEDVTNAKAAHGEAQIRGWTQELLNMVPSSVVRLLPKLRIRVRSLSGAHGEYSLAANNQGRGELSLNSSPRPEPEVRRTLWHELTHWLHMELPGSHPWVKQLVDHFRARTAGEQVAQLPHYGPGTRGKRDDWYEPYAGRIYNASWEATHEGVELPTRYVELLSLPPEELALHWNNPKTRETLLIVLEGFFDQSPPQPSQP